MSEAVQYPCQPVRILKAAASEFTTGLNMQQSNAPATTETWPDFSETQLRSQYLRSTFDLLSFELQKQLPECLQVTTLTCQ